jgi:lipopolysaccharide export system permease protein
MRILSKYVLRENSKILSWIFLILALLCFLIDFFERWDDFVENDVPTRLGLIYLACRMPQYIMYVLPVSMLLATFITLGLLGRNNEIIALKASGISGFAIVKPMLWTAAVLSVFSFFWAETLVPEASREATRIWQVEVKKSSKRTLVRANEIWFRSPSSQGLTFYRIGFMKVPEASLPGPRLERQSPEIPEIKDVSVLRISRAYDLLERVDAKEMVWEGESWTFIQGIRWAPGGSTDPRVERFEREVIPLPERPEDFQWVKQDVEAMGFFGLLEYIKRAKEEGYDVTAHVTDLHFKVASALFCLVTVLFTIPLAMRIPPRAGGLALGVALSMAIGFIYYLFMAVGLAFGHGGTLPPFLGAWGANLLFGSCGVWWLLHMRH